MGQNTRQRALWILFGFAFVVSWGVITPGATLETAFIPGRDPLLGAVAAGVGFWTGHVFGETLVENRWHLPGAATLTVAALTAGAGAAVPPLIGFPMGALAGGFFWSDSPTGRFRP